MSLRIGQLSGSTMSGAWNITDWVPILVKSSIVLGSLPILKGVSTMVVLDDVISDQKILQVVDWLPMDIAGRTVVDAVVYPKTLLELIHLVHPRPVSWLDVFSDIKHVLGNRCSLIPFPEWLSQVEERAADASPHSTRHGGSREYLTPNSVSRSR